MAKVTQVVESATWEILNWFLGERSRPRKGRSHCMPRIFQNHKVSVWSEEGERDVSGGSTAKPLKTLHITGGNY